VGEIAAAGNSMLVEIHTTASDSFPRRKSAVRRNIGKAAQAGLQKSGRK